MTEESYEGWTILELMGHRKLAGLVSEQAVGGGSMLRIDIYTGDDELPTATQLYGVQSVYCMTPSTEELCRKYAGQRLPQPVARYELPEPDQYERGCPDDGDEL